ncbi:hypothetical protein FRC09_016027, partial [Ceratobasidium sp. 395]
LNSVLENTFALRAQLPIVFIDRGPGLESLADTFTCYLTGDYTEKPIIAKWLDDLTEAAETMSLQKVRSNKGKKVSKPSEAQKHTNAWIELTQEEECSRKKQKVDAVAKVKQRADAIKNTAQDCNWKLGFDDLTDVEDQGKVYTTRRKGYDITKELYVKCRSKKTGTVHTATRQNGTNSPGPYHKPSIFSIISEMSVDMLAQQFWSAI